MPMIELTLPENTLSQSDQNKLMKQLTNTLLKWEGAPIDNAMAQAISWGFVDQKPAGTFYVGGAPIEEDHWRVKVTVPEGVFDDDKKAGLVKDVTEIIETVASDNAAGFRCWCIIREVKDGNWGSDSKIFRRRDIVKMVYAG